MLCPKCGSRFRVLNTRTADQSGSEFAKQGHIVNRVGKFVNWYTVDFVARQRKCPNCGFQTDTVELLLEDYKSIIVELITDEKLAKEILAKAKKKK